MMVGKVSLECSKLTSRHNLSIYFEKLRKMIKCLSKDDDSAKIQTEDTQKYAPTVLPYNVTSHKYKFGVPNFYTWKDPKI